MNIKVYCILFLVSFFVICGSNAQNLSKDLQTVFDACQSIRMAIDAGNTSSLKAANKVLKHCGIRPFTSLYPIDSEPVSLNGHFVFDCTFIDSLITGRDVYKFAQRYAELNGVKGLSTSGKVCAKTCAVKSLSSAKFIFTAKGHQELAVVTEPGGLITLRIHDITHDIWCNDTVNVYKGQASRIAIMNLPDERSEIELNIMNRCNRDISFVVIGR